MAKDLKKTEEGAPAPEEAAPKKGGKLKLIIIVVAALLVGAGLGFGVVKFLGGGGEPPVAEGQAAPPAEAAPAEPAKTEKPAEGGHTAPPAEGAAAPAEGEAASLMVEFQPFVVNLNDSGGKRFLKMSMSMEAETAEVQKELTAKMPQVRDMVLLLLSSLAYDDVSTMDGKMRLRSQILNRTNTQLTYGKVKNIYFSEFVVQ